MRQLKCENCHSIDVVKVREGVYHCNHCGTTYTDDPLKVDIDVSGTVDNVPGAATLARKLQIARTNQDQGDYEEANEVYKLLAKDFPDQKILWTEWSDCIKRYVAGRSIPVLQGRSFFDKEYVFSHAAMMRTREENAQWDLGWNTINSQAAKSVISGDVISGDRLFEVARRFTGIGEGIGGVMRYEMSYPAFRKAFCDESESWKSVIEEGEAVARRIRKDGLYLNSYDENNPATYLTPDVYTTSAYPVFMLGNVMVTSDQPYDPGQQKYQSFRLTHHSLFVTRKESIFKHFCHDAAVTWNRTAKKQCPYCGWDNLKTNIFGTKKCLNCGRKIEYKDEN